jgi:hypothetical protein
LVEKEYRKLRSLRVAQNISRLAIIFAGGILLVRA